MRLRSVTSRIWSGVNDDEAMPHDIMNRMLMASRTMAARIERAECATILDFAGQAQARGTDAVIHRIGGGAAVFAGPGQPFNKVAGLGFADLDSASLDEMERVFDALGAELRVELATIADPHVGKLLTHRGYELAGYENVLGLALDVAVIESLTPALEADAARAVIVSRAAPDETRLWIETVADGFGHLDQFDGPPPTESFERETIVNVFSASSGTPGMALYLARRDGEVAGGGAIRISDGLAQLAGAATLPPHRRRGVQSALLRARLLDAARQGCDLAIVTTEPASKSQQNVQRAGFTLLYARAVLIRVAR
jgi:GNAT superfamily N-acetyltransferase